MELSRGFNLSSNISPFSVISLLAVFQSLEILSQSVPLISAYNAACSSADSSCRCWRRCSCPYPFSCSRTLSHSISKLLGFLALGFLALVAVAKYIPRAGCVSFLCRRASLRGVSTWSKQAGNGRQLFGLKGASQLSCACLSL